jgi:hypothetical protein
MDNLVFLFKSHAPHLQYTKQLIETTALHNRDNITVYLSIPKQQKQLFKDSIGTDGYNMIFDEDIIQNNLQQNWFSQQLVKMKFSEMNLCNNYFWVDGDSYFIRDFFIDDFMFDDKTPYTTMHENKDLFQWMATQGEMMDSVLTSYKNDRDKVKSLFGRKGKYYDWTCPNLWSVEVFNHMKKNYLEPNNLSFEKLLQYMPGELVWYGEYVLATQPIRLIPCESWFKPFHYMQQMIDCKNQGNTEETLAKNFLGIVMPSKETTQLRF